MTLRWWTRRRLLLAAVAAGAALVVILSAPAPPPAPVPGRPVAAGDGFVLYAERDLPPALLAWYRQVTATALANAADCFPGRTLPKVQVHFLSDSATRRDYGLLEAGARTCLPATVVVNTYNAPTLLHEFIHLHQARVWPAAYAAPDWQWLIEGMAVSGSFFANQGRLLATCHEYAMAPDAGETWLRRFDASERSYRLATGLVLWLAAAHGDTAVRALAAAAEAGSRVDAGLAATVGRQVPELLADWRAWLAANGLERALAARYDRCLHLTRMVLPWREVPAGFRDGNMIMHFFSPPPEIEEHIIRWNLRVAPRDGADGFAAWQDNYRAMARAGRGNDLLQRTRTHADPLLRAVTEEIITAPPAVVISP